MDPRKLRRQTTCFHGDKVCAASSRSRDRWKIIQGWKPLKRFGWRQCQWSTCLQLTRQHLWFSSSLQSISAWSFRHFPRQRAFLSITVLFRIWEMYHSNSQSSFVNIYTCKTLKTTAKWRSGSCPNPPTDHQQYEYRPKQQRSLKSTNGLLVFKSLKSVVCGCVVYYSRNPLQNGFLVGSKQATQTICDERGWYSCTIYIWTGHSISSWTPNPKKYHIPLIPWNSCTFSGTKSPPTVVA